MDTGRDESLAEADGRIAKLRLLVDREVLPLIAWYQRKKRWPRRLHRLSGVVVIGLGATIPLLSAYSASQPVRVVVGAAGAIITVITGLATVYEWHKSWRIFTVAQTELEAHRLRWELAITAAEAEADQAERLRLSFAATESLLEHAALARRSETAEFFADQRALPRTQLLS